MSGSITPALVQQIQDLINVWNTHQAQLGAWLGGTMNGGPNADGRYPLVDALGRETLVPAPASFSDMVHGPANIAELAKAAAELARDQAEASAQRADLQSNLAEAARGAAVEARNLAQEHRNHAGTSEANARHWAEQAQLKGEATAVDRAIVEQLASETADNAALAALDAQAAAASAALAATFDPNLFDKKSDTLAASRLTGMIDPARIPVLVGQTPVVSTGGIANLTAGQQSGVVAGTLVATTDGRRWVYSGSGSKTAEASYIEQGDVTPDWTVIANKPSFFPTNIANVTGLQTALDGKADALHSHAEYALVAGTQTLTGEKTFSNPHVRHVGRTDRPAVLHRHDGDNYWQLLTAPSDPNGGYNNLRPYKLNTATGHITLGEGAQINKGLAVFGGLTVDGQSALVGANASDAVLTSETGLGKTGNGGLETGTKDAAWWGGLPTGYSKMANLTSANGAPGGGGYGYFFKMARRDNSNGWSGLWTNHGGSYRRLFLGFADNANVMPSWNEVWTDGNFNPAWKLDCATDRWIASLEGKHRFYFAANGRTFIRGHYGVEIRNSADTRIGSFEEDGSLVTGRGFFSDGVVINNTSPTIFLQDSNHRSAFIHVNENRFYILRGAGVNSGSWEATGSGWPMVIDLNDNRVDFNGDIYVSGEKWLRVLGNTGIYFHSWGGGWRMTDTNWIRSFGDKSIVTGGTVQMGAFTVTSDRRLKTDITPLKGAAEIIDATNVYEFTKAGRRQYGVIAQEAREVAPILVSEGADLHPEDGDPILAVDLTGYIPLLIDEVKALRQRVSSLEGRA